MSAAPAPRKSVARRIVALFLLCGLLPVAATIVISYDSVVETLIEQRVALLRGAAANYATVLVDRLSVAERLAQAAMRGAPGKALHEEQTLRKHFVAAAALGAGAPDAILFGAPASVPAAQAAGAARPLLKDAGKVLVLRNDRAPPAVWIVVSELSAGRSGRRMAFQLDPAFLWARDDALPHLTELCVLDASGRALDCAGAPPSSVLETFRRAPAGSAGRGLAWEAGGISYLSGLRELFLAGRFGADPWLIVASQPEEYALAPVRSLATAVVPVVLLGLLVAAFFGLVQVRRTLRPLKELTQAAGRIAVRDFDFHVQTERDDEFALLGRSFNAMSARLGRQFKALLAQAEIDAVILSSADLTRIAAIVLHRLAEMVRAEHYALLLAGSAAGEPYRLYSAGAAGAAQVREVQISEEESRQLQGAMRGLRLSRGELPSGSALAAVPGESLFALPFSLGQELGGALILGNQGGPGPGGEEVSLLWKLGDRVAVALATARRDQELHRRAYYDSLTSLPNRSLAMDELARAVAAAARQRRALAVLFVDLDGFSDVNDSLGHTAGDAVLVRAAARLRACVRKSDIVARLGGDEFALVLSELREPADAAVVARHAIKALCAPYDLAEGAAHVSASIGVALYPGDGDSAQELLTHADLAMYHAKEAGPGRTAFFEAAMNEEVRRRVEMERELRAALEKQQFQLYYQPQLSLGSGRIVGGEALVRWVHPARGLMPPAHFIAFAETNGLIEPIGQWVLRAACAQLVAWRAEGLPIEYVSVNVSARQFQAAGFSDAVAGAIEAFGVPASGLHLEITESAVLGEQAAVQANLAGLTALGVPLELDDFGTGYSSLGHLQKLPVTAIKLDRIFIRSIHESASARTLARAAIDMAHALGKSVIAEGVELAEQVALLAEMGCDMVQGFHVSAPLPADNFAALVRQRGASTPVAVRSQRRS